MIISSYGNPIPDSWTEIDVTNPTEGFKVSQRFYPAGVVLVDYFQTVPPVIGGEGICAGLWINSNLHPFPETEIKI